jgi:hypothetical protein
MNWSDERYVKLYVRQTATWRMWPWQGRCVLPLLLQVANGAGVIDVGRRDPLQALSALIQVPVDVVQVGVEALIADGTIEVVPNGYLLPKFIEAQEATKTDALRKRDQRERERTKARERTREAVTQSHELSRAVTQSHELSPSSPAQPSPAQPSSAQPSSAQPSSAQPSSAQPSPEETKKPLSTCVDRPELQLVGEERKPPKAPSQKLEESLDEETELQVWEHWRQVLKHPRARLDDKRRKLIALRLKDYSVEELQAAIDGCAKSPHHMGQNDSHQVYDDIELILRDAKHVESFMAKAADPRPSCPPRHEEIPLEMRPARRL